MRESLSLWKKLTGKVLLLATLLVWGGIQSAWAQTTVRGTVTDPEGLPLIGATVVVADTNRGATTNVNGEYSIDAPVGSTLVFTYIGLTTQEFKVAPGMTVLDVQMKEDASALEEVVVVGYGTQRKASLTGSVAQISGEELMKGPATNVSSMLAGKLTGISSVQESGQPGADQAEIVIRGSIYGATYIVDGMPRSIADLDPNEIETISVLKDAAAAAVYGLSGAGGVVLVTTKRGKIGAPKITYSGSVGASFNANFPEFLDGPSYAYWYNRALELDGKEPIFSQQDVDNMIAGTNGWGNTNWIAETFGTGVNNQHSVTASGGTEKMNYFASLGYLGQKGNIDNFSYKRYNARVNVGAQIAKNLHFQMNLSGQVGDKRQPGLTAGGSWSDQQTEAEIPWYSIAEQAIFAHPYLPVTYNGQYVASMNRHSQPYNPVAAINESGEFNTQTTALQTNVNLKWDLPWVEGLSLALTGAYDQSISISKNLSTPYYMIAEVVPSQLSANPKEYSGLTVDPRANTVNKLHEGLAQSKQLVGQFSINYDRIFAEKHEVKVLALMEVRDYKYNNFGAYGAGLDFMELPELSNTQVDTSNAKPIYGGSDHTRSAGFVARLNYAYDNRYLVELAGRYDGSYKFAGMNGSRWGFFPSASLGWRVSNEAFFENARDVINELKIRVSAGEVGADASVPAYSYLSKLSFVSGYPAIIGGSLANGLYTSAVANLGLTWERSRSMNVGFDLRMWEGKLSLEADYFYTYTYDMLTASSGYPPSMGGYYPTYVNDAQEIDTKGVEFTISHDNQVGDFSYGVRFNMSWARSRYLTYPDAIGTPSYQLHAGQSVYSQKALVADGLFQSEEEIDNSPWVDGIRPSVGDIKYIDLDGDGVIDPWKDQAFVARANRPELTAGLNLYAAWKGIDLSMFFTAGAMFDAQLTGTYYNWAQDATPFTKLFKDGANSPRYLAENSWTPENPDAEYPRLSINRSNDNNSLTSTFWFRDGKYLRLKTMQIGYTFPKKWMSRLGISEFRIFAEGSNLFTLTGLPEGVDPEAPGVNLGYYPQQRTIMGGISLTF